jgi:hypothetical protein
VFVLPAAAEYVVPVTPVPEKVPLAGKAPSAAKFSGSADTQTDWFAGQVITGKAFTVMLNVQELVQPFPSV